MKTLRRRSQIFLKTRNLRYIYVVVFTVTPPNQIVFIQTTDHFLANFVLDFIIFWRNACSSGNHTSRNWWTWKVVKSLLYKNSCLLGKTECCTPDLWWPCKALIYYQNTLQVVKQKVVGQILIVMVFHVYVYSMYISLLQFMCKWLFMYLITGVQNC